MILQHKDKIIPMIQVAIKNNEDYHFYDINYLFHKNGELYFGAKYSEKGAVCKVSIRCVLYNGEISARFKDNPEFPFIIGNLSKDIKFNFEFNIDER